MIRSLFLILALAAGWSAQAQTEKRIIPKSQQQAAEQRKTDKRLEEIQDSIDYAKAVQALENLEFVVEADQLVFKRGQSAFVSSSTNFISMHDDKTVVQVAPFNGGGPNGVGGITVEGRASDIAEDRQTREHLLHDERPRQRDLGHGDHLDGQRVEPRIGDGKSQLQLEPDYAQRHTDTGRGVARLQGKGVLTAVRTAFSGAGTARCRDNQTKTTQGSEDPASFFPVRPRPALSLHGVCRRREHYPAVGTPTGSGPKDGDGNGTKGITSSRR